MDAIIQKSYTTIFFDLDHTLWDYNTSSKETLNDIFNKYMKSQKSNFDLFLKTFHKVNDTLWHKYNKGTVNKDYIRDNRFDQILEILDINDNSLSHEMSTEYLFECPRKPNLFPFTKEVLESLHDKYSLHILSNGFEDVQSIKLVSSGIDQYFDNVITSDGCGYQKPDPAFFSHALDICDSKSENTIMIGDNLKTDISGALNSGIDTAYFNPSKNGRPHKSTYEISSLDQLLRIVG